MKLRDAINEQPKQDKQVINESLKLRIMKWLFGMQKDDVANELGLPPNATKDFEKVKSDYEKLRKKYPHYFKK